ncbi:MAG TPA: ABC transporter permease [Solirubrobacteraceae bacterium]|jgi:ABC-2 type transport system permease protein|nr:ABC transporter permease [Solirubrobacteraceae bacterium]
MSELTYPFDVDVAADQSARAGGRSGLTELSTMVIRALRLSLRNVDGLISALALPVMLMVMFVYFFGGAIRVGGRYIDYVVPGVLLVCAGFGAGTTAVTVSTDLAGGIVDRFRSLDVRPRSLLAGHVVASVGRNLTSAALAVGVAFAIGFSPRAGIGYWLAAIGLLALFILALSWLAAAIGVLMRSPEGAQGITFLIAFLPYPSSAFVPIRTMPAWLQGFARHQPVTPVIDSLRALLAGHSPGASAVTAAAWSVGIILASVLAAGLLFARRTA